MELEKLKLLYQVWKAERRSEYQILVTPDVDVAMSTMESLGGPKKWVYIYYFFDNKFHFLCGILDGKYSRVDYRIAVRMLLRPDEKEFYFPQKGLWRGRRSLV